jgi:hypothetical protein
MKYLIVAMVICSVMNCSKHEEIGANQYVTLSYNETQCSDVWTRGSSDNITKTNLAALLNTKNIYVSDITIKQESTGAVCAACTCPTGKVIYVSTLNSDEMKKKLSDLGFK